MHDTVVRSLISGMETEPDSTFVVSETLDGVSFALNYKHVQCCRILRGAPVERDDDVPRKAQWSGRLTVYLCDRASPMRFQVQPDATRLPDPDAPEEAAQLHFIMFELDTGKRRNVEVADTRNGRVLFPKNDIALVGIPTELLAS